MGGQTQIQPGANQQPEQLPEKADSKTIPQPAPCLHTLQARYAQTFCMLMQVLSPFKVCHDAEIFCDRGVASQ
jgi:hypothetical protein